jgi:5-methylcytosine-specific restriction enzyme A
MRPRKLCRHSGCNELIEGVETYCPEHKKEMLREYDKRRGTAQQRGYNYRWQKYSKAFLKQPGNQYCKLRIDGRCKLKAECVDHIEPPPDPRHPLFWDPSNHQSSCLPCNSIKGNKVIKGSEWEL